MRYHKKKPSSNPPCISGMTEKRTGGDSNRDRYGGRSHQRGYHPYRSNGHSGNRSSSHSSSNRLVSVNDAIKTDRILSIESFANVERIKDTADITLEYAKYVKKHQKAHLRSIFNAHKKEKWITSLVKNNENSKITTLESFPAGFSLLYTEDFGMKVEESSNEAVFSTGTETFLHPADSSDDLPASFTGLLPEFSNQIITMSNIPPYVDGEALEGHLKELAPDSEIEITAPNADKNFYRLAWLKLTDNSPEKISELVPKLEALDSIEGAKVYFGIASSNFRRFKVTSYLEGFEGDFFTLASKFIELFDPNFDGELIKSVESIADSLDKAVFYLRKVHGFCFYCGCKFSCHQEMLAKCGDLHLRSPKPATSEPVKHDQHRLIEKLSALSDFIANLNEISGEEGSTDLEGALTESSIKKVEEGKYRCEHCSKAFKGPEFVLKHLQLKHEDVVKQTQEDLADFAGLLANAKLWLFPGTMIPRYTKIRSKFSSNNNAYTSGSRDSQGSSKSSLSRSSNSRVSSREYMDWDASVSNSTTEISYDL